MIWHTARSTWSGSAGRSSQRDVGATRPTASRSPARRATRRCAPTPGRARSRCTGTRRPRSRSPHHAARSRSSGRPRRGSAPPCPISQSRVSNPSWRSRRATPQSGRSANISDRVAPRRIRYRAPVAVGLGSPRARGRCRGTRPGARARAPGSCSRPRGPRRPRCRTGRRRARTSAPTPDRGRSAVVAAPDALRGGSSGSPSRRDPLLLDGGEHVPVAVELRRRPIRAAPRARGCRRCSGSPSPSRGDASSTRRRARRRATAAP